MKNILKNTVPLATYWLSFSFGFFIVVAFNLPTGNWIKYLLAAMIAINTVTGALISAGQMKWGISVLLAQLLLSGTVQIASGFKAYYAFFDYGNIILQGVFNYDGGKSQAYGIFSLIASLIFIIAPFFIGSAIKNRVKSKK